MDIVQLCDRIDRLTAEADLAMNDETNNRQIVLETLLGDLAELTSQARQAPRHSSVISIAGDGGTSIAIGGHFRGR